MPEGMNSAPGFAKHPHYELVSAAVSKRVSATVGGAVIADSKFHIFDGSHWTLDGAKYFGEKIDFSIF